MVELNVMPWFIAGPSLSISNFFLSNGDQLRTPTSTFIFYSNAWRTKVRKVTLNKSIWLDPLQLDEQEKKMFFFPWLLTSQLRLKIPCSIFFKRIWSWFEVFATFLEKRPKKDPNPLEVGPNCFRKANWLIGWCECFDFFYLKYRVRAFSPSRILAGF